MWLATPNPDRYPCHGGFYHPLVGKTGAPESLGLPGFKTDSVKGRGTMKPINHKLAEVLIRGLIKLRAVDVNEVIFDGDVVSPKNHPRCLPPSDDYGGASLGYAPRMLLAAEEPEEYEREFAPDKAFSEGENWQKKSPGLFCGRKAPGGSCVCVLRCITRT